MSIWVLGATNTDHSFQLNAPLRMHDSNPVSDHVSLGGVGYNIAHHLDQLTSDSQFVTAFNDALSLTRVTSVSVAQPPAYYAVVDTDMTVAFAAMDGLESLEVTPILTALNALKKTDTLVMDLNFPAALLKTVAKETPAKIWVEATSAHKISKVDALLPYVHGIKLNRIEAQTWMNNDDTDKATEHLARLDLQEIVLTLGAAGAVHMTDEIIHYQDVAPFKAVHLSGVGDAFMAGFLLGDDSQSQMQSAFTLAALTAGSKSATIDALSLDQFMQERKQRDVRIQSRRPRRPQ